MTGAIRSGSALSPPPSPAAASSPANSCGVSASGSRALIAATTSGATGTGPAFTAARTDSSRSASSPASEPALAAVTVRCRFAGEVPWANWGCTYQFRAFISSATVNTSKSSRSAVTATSVESGEPSTRRPSMRAMPSRISRTAPSVRSASPR